jgi:hypothetical protein
MMKAGWMAPLLVVAMAGCGSQEPAAPTDNAVNSANAAAAEPAAAPSNVAANALEPLNPPEPGQPGGLPDDRTPLNEGKIDLKGPQGAAQIVERYVVSVESKDYATAQAQWAKGSPESAMSPAAFAAQFARFSEYHANIGGPGKPEGAAGSLYVTVPIQIYARDAATGKPWYALRSVVVRRVNDVPGATAEERSWHIERIEDSATK